MKKHPCFGCDITFKVYESDDKNMPNFFFGSGAGDNEISPINASSHFYKYKTGFFSKETIFICSKCKTSLNMKYGATRTDTVTDKTIYFGFDMCYESIVENGVSGKTDFGNGAWFKHESGPYSDMYLQGQFLEDIKDENKHALIKNSLSTLTEDWEDYVNAKTKSRKNLKKDLKTIRKHLNRSIIKLLKEKKSKITASDIDAHLKHKDVDEIKELCEEMYHNGEINRTANYRYFILTEEKKKPKPKKASAPKSESTDIPEQIKKLSDLKDQGILTEEEFQSKKKDLLDKM